MTGYGIPVALSLSTLGTCIRLVAQLLLRVQRRVYTQGNKKHYVIWNFNTKNDLESVCVLINK